MNIRVKICGNKRLEDALQSIRLGADAVGLLVGQTHASRDFISPDTARSIVSQLPPFCTIVLVTQKTDVKEIVELVNFVGVNTVQLHGESTTSDVIGLKRKLPFLKIIKALHIIDDKSILEGEKFVGIADAMLLDSVDKTENKIGGTGKIHDWSISKKIVEKTRIPIILAGGLNPENVTEAIRIVSPFGVDVNSGTKGKDGFKDYKKMKLFIRRAKGIDS